MRDLSLFLLLAVVTGCGGATMVAAPNDAVTLTEQAAINQRLDAIRTEAERAARIAAEAPTPPAMAPALAIVPPPRPGPPPLAPLPAPR